MSTHESRTVLITGGSKGIGRACAEWFFEAGHHVVVTGRDEAALESVTSACPGIEARAFDVADAAAWRDLGLEPDVLVANAGIEYSASLGGTDLEDWSRLLAVNATAVFLAAKAVVPGMRERGWGRFITVGSIASHHGLRYATAYAASKHAALGLTRALATELAGSGVTANVVSPGFVATNMADRSVASIVAATGRTEAEALRILEEVQPVGRLIQPQEVAAAVGYLASSSDAVNGQSIILDGGGLQQ